MHIKTVRKRLIFCVTLLLLPLIGISGEVVAKKANYESEGSLVSERSSDRKLHFGVRGGVNANSFDNIQTVHISPFDIGGLIELADDQDLEALFLLEPATGVDVAYHGGFYVRYQLNPAFGLQAEALYNIQGGARQMRSLISGGIKQSRVSLHNIEVPLLASLRVFQAGLTSGHLMAGGAAAYNLVSTQNYTNILVDNSLGVLTLVDGNYENVTSQYRDFQFGAYLGTRFDTDVGNLQVSMDIRYRFGIGRVNNLSRIYDQFDARANTLAISIGVGI